MRAQLAEDVLQELQRDALRPGELLALRVGPLRRTRELDGCAQRVVGLMLDRPVLAWVRQAGWFWALTALAGMVATWRAPRPP